MAKNSPLSSWMPKIRPKHEPKFHQELKLTGVAKSIMLPLISDRNGPLVRYFVILLPDYSSSYSFLLVSHFSLFINNTLTTSSLLSVTSFTSLLYFFFSLLASSPSLSQLFPHVLYAPSNSSD